MMKKPIIPGLTSTFLLLLLLFFSSGCETSNLPVMPVVHPGQDQTSLGGEQGIRSTGPGHHVSVYPLHNHDSDSLDFLVVAQNASADAFYFGESDIEPMDWYGNPIQRIPLHQAIEGLRREEQRVITRVIEVYRRSRQNSTQQPVRGDVASTITGKPVDKEAQLKQHIEAIHRIYQNQETRMIENWLEPAMVYPGDYNQGMFRVRRPDTGHTMIVLKIKQGDETHWIEFELGQPDRVSGEVAHAN